MADLPYDYALSEEIARWTFEVHLTQNSTARQNWFISFTNPTAGPWKRMTAPGDDGKPVEILRFKQKQERPDLVLVSDSLRQLLIIEAKDSLPKLVKPEQMRKSVSVILDLKKELSALMVPAWVRRRGYQLVPGFLWGGSNPEGEVRTLVKAYDQDPRTNAIPGLLGIGIRTRSSGLSVHVVGRASGHVDLESLRESLGL